MFKIFFPSFQKAIHYKHGWLGKKVEIISNVASSKLFWIDGRTDTTMTHERVIL